MKLSKVDSPQSWQLYRGRLFGKISRISFVYMSIIYSSPLHLVTFILLHNEIFAQIMQEDLAKDFIPNRSYLIGKII